MTRAEQKLQTRSNILAAALKKMNEDKGFSSLGLREVAKEAGIAPASFYRHFKNMEELGMALVEGEYCPMMILSSPSGSIHMSMCWVESKLVGKPGEMVKFIEEFAVK